MGSAELEYRDEISTADIVAKRLHKSQGCFSYAIDSLPLVTFTSASKCEYQLSPKHQKFEIPVCYGDKERTPWTVRIIGRNQMVEVRRCIEEPFWRGGIDRLDKLCDILVNVGAAPECIVMGHMAYGFWEWNAQQCTAPTVEDYLLKTTAPSESPAEESSQDCLLFLLGES